MSDSKDRKICLGLRADEKTLVRGVSGIEFEITPKLIADVAEAISELNLDFESYEDAAERICIRMLLAVEATRSPWPLLYLLGKK